LFIKPRNSLKMHVSAKYRSFRSTFIYINEDSRFVKRLL